MMADDSMNTNGIVMLDLTKEGKISDRGHSVVTDEWLTGTVLGMLYPGIRVAILTVPTDAVEWGEKAIVLDRMCSITHDGIKYRLVGASGSAKNGKFYYADEAHAPALRQRFLSWPEAAITYFGILTSNCGKALKKIKNARILIVPDSVFGTNDCRGWLDETQVELLKLPKGHVYQTREGFDVVLPNGKTVGTQGKGLLKAMPHDVAQLLGVDIILPESSVKPLPELSKWMNPIMEIPKDSPLTPEVHLANLRRLQAAECALEDIKAVVKADEGTEVEKAEARLKLVAASLKLAAIKQELAVDPKDTAVHFVDKTFGGRLFTSDMVIGVREVSHDLSFESSYTVLQHAPWKVLDQEITPEAMAKIAELTEAWQAANHLKVVELIGKKLPAIDSSNQIDEVTQRQSVREEEELRAIEAILIADGTGKITRHPKVHKVLGQLIARWSFKLCTGGGLTLPAFTLVDDGYLFLHEGKIFDASNWVPMDTAIVSSLTSARGLCVRYPVRMAEDMLPLKHSGLVDTAAMLVRLQGLAPEKASWVAEHQLCLTGTYTLHQDTAKKNGGDFDGDMICVIDEARYPMFVDARFTMVEHAAVKKTKATRLRSDWYNLECIAMGAMGNQIGVITDLISACIACGHEEAVYELVGELQKEIDSLKHNTRADRSVLKGIREKAPKPEWLNYKKAQSLKELPMLDQKTLLDTDRIGKFYQKLRSRIDLMMGEPMQLSQFAGLVVGNTPTQEMFDECETIRRVFNAAHNVIRAATDAEDGRVAAARKAVEEAMKSKDDDMLAKARNVLSKARKSQEVGKEWSKAKSKSIGNIVACWAGSKHTNRKAWCQAMFKIVHDSKSEKATGALAFHAFPQEIVDALAERTGGKRMAVAQPNVLGEVSVEGLSLYHRILGKGKSYMFRYDEKSRMLVK